MKTSSFSLKFRTIVLLLLFQNLLLFSQKTPQQVIILHTNDMHARIDNMAKLAFLKDSLLKTNPLVFLVSAGDNFTGNPVVDMVADKGYPMIDIMNRCGFDVSTLGNHEFDLGQDFLNKRFSQSSFPFVCCNIDATKTSLNQPPPFVVLNKGDSIHLVFLGVLQRGPNGLPDSHPLKLKGLQFFDGIQIASEYTYLKGEYGNLIALTHLGVEDDKKLAETLPMIDIIIGGHSHTLLDTAIFIEGVMITQAGFHMKWVGKTTITMQHDRILSKKDEIIPISQIRSERKDVRQFIDKYNDNEELKRVVGQTARPIKGYEELGALMTDALRDELKVDIAFLNRGGIRIDSLAAGNIMMKDVYRLDPFGNQAVICPMHLEEIKSLICQAYNMNQRLDLQVSGMKYIVLTDQSGKCVKVDLQFDTGLMNTSGLYRVAMNSYIASAYSFDHAAEIETLDITTAKVLMDYLEKVKTVDYQGVKRISISVYK